MAREVFMKKKPIKIPVGNGKFATVSYEDRDLAKHKWWIRADGHVEGDMNGMRVLLCEVVAERMGIKERNSERN